MCMYAYAYMYMCIYMYICIYIHICIYVYMYMCMYIDGTTHSENAKREMRVAAYRVGHMVNIPNLPLVDQQ